MFSPAVSIVSNIEERPPLETTQGLFQLSLKQIVFYGYDISNNNIVFVLLVHPYRLSLIIVLVLSFCMLEYTIFIHFCLSVTT